MKRKKSKKKKVGKKEKSFSLNVGVNTIDGKTMGPISTKARYEEKFYESFLE